MKIIDCGSPELEVNRHALVLSFCCDVFVRRRGILLQINILLMYITQCMPRFLAETLL